MKKKLTLFFSIFLLMNIANSQCQNISFELGDFTNWIGNAKAGTGCSPVTWTGTPPCPLPGDRFLIINDPVPVPVSDSCSDFSRTPPGKNMSVRVGNRLVGGQIDELTYTISVTPTNNFLLYEYAAILEDPINMLHVENDRPAFYVDIQGYGDTVIDTCNSVYEWSNPNDIGLRMCRIIGNDGSNTAFYRPWTKVGVDLRDYQNLPAPFNEVTVTFRSRDCQLCGHFGYGFFYAECDSLGIEVEYCENNNYAVLRAPDGFTYKWMDSSSTQEISINNPTEGDTVWVDLETRGGCASRLYAVLKAYRVKANFNSPDTVCVMDEVKFFDSSYAEYVVSSGSIPIESYYWDFGDSTYADSANPTHVYTLPGVYNVNLIAVAEGGCEDTVTKLIYVGDIPQANFNYNNVCEGNLASFVDWSNSASPISSWNWDFGEASPNDTSSNQNPGYNFQNPGVYPVTLIVDNIFGCSDTIVDSIQVFIKPKPEFSYQYPCQNDTAYFTTIKDSIDGLLSTNWDFGDGNFSVDFDPKHVYSLSLNYLVTLSVVDSNGCTGEISKNIDVKNLNVDFNLVDFCVNEGEWFDTISNISLANFLWDFDDGTTSTQAPFYKQFNLPGTYNVTLYGTSFDGCSDSVVKAIQVYELPTVDFEPIEKYGCEMLCTDFLNLSASFFGIRSYQWSFGDGNYSNDSTPRHCYLDTGVFDVSLIIESGKGCKDTIDKPTLIYVSPRPEADFKVNPTLVPVFDTEVSLTNTSDGEKYVEWYFGDSLGYLGNQIDYVLPDKELRTHEICLKAYTNPVCYDSICKLVEVYGDLIYVPNSFTPNKDGTNDFFFPSTYGLQDDGFEFMIFDRWGELLFSTKSKEKGWDGTHKGILCKEDVYVWKLKGVVDKTKERVTEYGHVTLLKKRSD